MHNSQVCQLLYMLLFGHSDNMIGFEIGPNSGGQAIIQWLEELYLANTNIIRNKLVNMYYVYGRKSSKF
jgi:hypothetical protein